MTAIRTLRKQAKLTQTEFAHAVGIDQGQLSRIERGQADVYLCTLRRMATVLNVPLPCLLADDERKAA
jgi:transcriptional regulator with XRE-family HTH domain